MALGAGGTLVKYVIFIFNLIFALTGLIILGCGIWVFTRMNHYVEWLDMGFFSSPNILIVVGLVIFTVAFFGCCGAAKENYCMIISFSIFLGIIFAVEMGVGIAAYMKHSDLESHLEKRLNNSIADYNINPEVTKTYDMLQTELKCCGVNGPADWAGKIPESCCASGLKVIDKVPETCSMSAQYLHHEGCYPKLRTLIANNMYIVGGVGLGIAGVQMLGILFACFLGCSIKREYQTV